MPFSRRSLLPVHACAKVTKYLPGLHDTLRAIRSLSHRMRGWNLCDINDSVQPGTVFSLVKPCFRPRGIDHAKRVGWRHQWSDCAPSRPLSSPIGAWLNSCRMTLLEQLHDHTGKRQSVTSTLVVVSFGIVWYRLVSFGIPWSPKAFGPLWISTIKIATDTATPTATIVRGRCNVMDSV